LLRETVLNEEQARFVRMIELSGEGLLEIINDVLDISKIEAGRLELSIEPLDPILLANDVLEVMRPKAEQKGLRLTVRLISQVPQFVQCDRSRLRQILVNLVGNAIKFTAKGSVILELGFGPADCLLGRVIDTGIGIAPEGLGRLFKPFSQVDSSATRSYGGTGLGLVICRRLCEALGGDISVTSELGQGSCFEFRILAPEARDPWKTAIAETRMEELILAESGDPLILIVDDNPANQRVLRLMLEVSGYRRLKFARTGEEARDYARDIEFDVIFMDVEMPGMDGVATTSSIRRMPHSIPTRPWIIGLSANVLTHTRERANMAGMNVFLAKPVRREALVQAIVRRGKTES
jgi:CheY-like chemotaxis protein